MSELTAIVLILAALLLGFTIGSLGGRKVEAEDTKTRLGRIAKSAVKDLPEGECLCLVLTIGREGVKTEHTKQPYPLEFGDN